MGEWESASPKLFLSYSKLNTLPLQKGSSLNNSVGSLCCVLQIISDLLMFKGTHKHEFDSRWKSFTLVKKSMENRVGNPCALHSCLY